MSTTTETPRRRLGAAAVLALAAAFAAAASAQPAAPASGASGAAGTPSTTGTSGTVAPGRSRAESPSAGSTATATATATESAGASGARYGFGQPASEAELARFYSSLPDGSDLPAGSGTVARGQTAYAEHCASCHGENLQGGVGDRLIGGRGTLVNSDPTKAPVKTVESYWPYATTLFDYIKRSMPFNAPGTLGNDEVYAICAYILSRAGIVGADATMDAKALAAIRMPNRDGFIPDPRPENFPPPSKAPHEQQVIAKPSK